VAVRAAVDVATLPLKKDAGPHVLREAASQVATNVANFYSMSSASKLLTKVVEAIAKARFRPVATARLVVAIEESAEAELAAATLGGAIDFPPGALEAVRASMARSRP